MAQDGFLQLSTNRTIQIAYDMVQSLKLLKLVRICLFVTVTFSSSAILVAQESNLIEISGQVIQEDTKEPLGGVSVQIKGTVAGTVTSNNGDFKLRTKLKFPFKLVF